MITLTALKVPSPLTTQAAVAVEGFAIIVENVDDKVNGQLNEKR